LELSERKGMIAPGFDADLVLLTADHQVRYSFVNGNLVYEA